MAFHDTLFPVDIAYGYEGGPGFSTVVQETASGHEIRVQRWAQARHRFRADQDLLTDTARAAVRDFYLARRGATHSFRFMDWHDYTSAPDGTAEPTAIDQVIGSGTGSAVNFALVKQYDTSGLNPYPRRINLPVAGSVLVALDGTPTANFTVNTTTGVVTMNSAPSNGVVVSAGFRFHVQTRFAESVDELLQQKALAYQVSRISEIEVVEVRDEAELPEVWVPGGSTVNLAFGAAITLSPSSGRFVHLKSTGTGVNVFLPAPGDILPGGEYWLIHNDANATGTINVRDDAGNLVAGPISSGGAKRILLSRNEGAGTTQWVAL